MGRAVIEGKLVTFGAWVAWSVVGCSSWASVLMSWIIRVWAAWFGPGDMGEVGKGFGMSEIEPGCCCMAE